MVDERFNKINASRDARKLFSVAGEIFFDRQGNLVGAISRVEVTSRVILYRPNKPQIVKDYRLEAITLMEEDLENVATEKSHE